MWLRRSLGPCPVGPWRISCLDYRHGNAWQGSGSPGQWLGELIATVGLLWVIGALTRTGNGHLGPALVPLWIGAAFVFTSSISLANPAVTIGRAFTDTFTSIALSSVGAFIFFQFVGAVLGAGLTEFFHPRSGIPEPLDLPDAVHAQEKLRSHSE